MAELDRAGREQQLVELDLDALSDVDDAEIDKMILKNDEKEFKMRVWNTLNSDWIKEQKQKRREKKLNEK